MQEDAVSVAARVRARAEDLVRRLPPARRQRWLLARKELLALARDGRQRTVLDAGCGDGLLTLDLADRLPRWRFVGVDLSETAVRSAERERRRRSVTNAQFIRADITRPALREPVDVALAMECLAEIPDDRAALRQLRAALHADGVLVAHVPTADWRPLLPNSPPTWRDEVRHGYSQQQLADLLSASGFRCRSLRLTQRNVVTLVQELRDRRRHARVRWLLPLAPWAAAAAALDTAGLTWGEPRGIFFTADLPDR
jgi:SAM-dependent methyltransferase